MKNIINKKFSGFYAYIGIIASLYVVSPFLKPNQQDMAGNAVFWLFIIGAYFLPSFIAGHRRHRDINAIQAMNLLLGWTGIFWLAALFWSLTGNVVPKTES